MIDILLEARAQLAHARMAAAWLEDQVDEYLGHFQNPSLVEGHPPGDVALLESQVEFFRSALHPALSSAIVLSVFSLMEQSLQRICERHAAYDKKGARCWAGATAGSVMIRVGTYLETMGGPRLADAQLLRDLDDLRKIRNHLTHRGLDFRAAPKGVLAAVQERAFLDAGGSADSNRILRWMFDLQARLLDAIEADLAPDERTPQPGS